MTEPLDLDALDRDDEGWCQCDELDYRCTWHRLIAELEATRAEVIRSHNEISAHVAQANETLARAKRAEATIARVEAIPNMGGSEFTSKGWNMALARVRAALRGDE